jgi:hypothetical protein
MGEPGGPGYEIWYLAQDVLDITTCIFSKKGGEANEEKICSSTCSDYDPFDGNTCICEFVHIQG